MKHCVTGIVVGSSVFFVAPEALAQVQVTLETRLIAQTISGSGASRQISNAVGSNFASGDRVRFTVQYRLVDHTAGALGNIYGTLGIHFSAEGVNTAGNGTLSRSALTTEGSTSINGENGSQNNSDGWGMGPLYPQAGTAAGFTGLHQPFRSALNGNDNGIVNGTFSGGSIASVTAIALGGVPALNQESGNWWGVYSFEFQANSGFSGPIRFNLSTTSTTLGIFRGSDVNSATYRLLQANQTHYDMGSLEIQFSKPTVTVSNQTITADPFVNPDSQSLVLATFSSLAQSKLDVTILGDGGIGAHGGVVSIVNDNTEDPSIVLDWNAPNAAIGNTYTVTFTYTDSVGDIQTGTVNVSVIPAPGAAALLALSGLFATRRRRVERVVE